MSTRRILTTRCALACIAAAVIFSCSNSTEIAVDSSASTTLAAAPTDDGDGTTVESGESTTIENEPEVTSTSTGDVAANETTTSLAETATTTMDESSREDQPAVYGLPDAYVAPAGWVESMTLYDASDGTSYESSEDPRLESFVYREYFAPLGSPAFPNSTDARDLDDGLYYLGGFRWDPTRPNTAELMLSRLVDCAGSEGKELFACDDIDFEPGIYAPLEQSQTFEIALDDRFTVLIWAFLEPIFEDERFQIHSWLGQGPDFASLLLDLHEVYTERITNPTREGATLEEIAAGLETDPNFRSIFLMPWGPWAAWQQPGSPVLSYGTTDIVPLCWNQESCIDGGSTYDTARSFDSFINRLGSVHIVNGRAAMFYPGYSPGS